MTFWPSRGVCPIALKDVDQVSVLNWVNEYDVKTDNSGLSDASAKQYLEDLLNVVRCTIERKRSHSVVSTSSESDRPKVASTPTRPSRSISIEADIRWHEI